MNRKFLILAICLASLILIDSINPAAAERKARRKRTTSSSPKSAPASLKVEVISRPESCDRKTRSGDQISMHYTGMLQDGTVFDSSLRGGRGPFTFALGMGQVIPGWDQGLQGMCIGEKRKLTIPPHLAYGEEGYPPVIPESATLVFTTELIGFA